MTWPTPQPGLVIRYSYLWQEEAAAGREEGSKDRPCAVILAVTDEEGRPRVYAVPITHTPPSADVEAIEIPPVTKQRLGLDGDRSWVVVSEANVFAWPGPDLRPVPGREPVTPAYGFFPPRFFGAVRDRFVVAHRRRAALVRRTE